MQLSANVMNQHNVNLSGMVHDDWSQTENKQYVVSKIWHQKNDGEQPKSFFIQTTTLKLYEITKNGDLILELDNDKNTELFDNIDKSALNYAKSSGITKKYELKDVKYKAIINEIELTPLKKINSLRLRILEGNKPTKFYLSDKEPQNMNDIKKYLVNGTNVKVILEIDGLVVDLKTNIIFTNIILRQVLIKKMKPIRIELTDYSFIDSENEDNDNKLTTLKEVILNTNTEFLDQNTSNSEKSDENPKKNKVKSKPLSKISSKQAIKEELSDSEDSDNDKNESDNNDTSEDESDNESNNNSDEESENEDLQEISDSDGSVDIANFISGMKNMKKK